MDRITLEEALERMCGDRKSKETEEIPIHECIGRVLAEDFMAQIMQPPFPRSAMDGYAVRAEEIKGASKEHPVCLKVQRKVCAGDEPAILSESGHAIRIMTGAPIPEGADCVVKQEETDYGEEVVKVFASAERNQNCCPAGEDFYTGEKLIEKGSVLNAYAVAALAGNGAETVRVRKKLTVALISSGDELIQPGKPLTPGKIYDTNLFFLRARCIQLGCELVLAETVGDREDEIQGAIEKAIEKADLIITTGGVSVGQKDLIPEIVSHWENTEVIFHGVNIKPGMPTLFALMEGKPFLGLSGNPYSASAVFELMGVILIAKLQGKSAYTHKIRYAKLENGFSKARPCKRIVRGYYDGEKVILSKFQKNGQVRAGIYSNCLVELEEGNECVPADAIVKMYLL